MRPYAPGTGSRLRRPLGGRLRTYRPGGRDAGSRLARIEKAFRRGELVLNAFSRWHLQHVGATSTGWTFADAGEIAKVAKIEIGLARRESGQICIETADETNAKELIQRFDCDPVKPDLLVAKRDWLRHPDPDHSFNRLLKAARSHGMSVHVIAALGNTGGHGDPLWQNAQFRLRYAESSYLHLQPRVSSIERRFGEALVRAGMNPVPQYQVAQYFLDFAVIAHSDETLPLRLDIEVDGRYWHEEMPGCLRMEDQIRNTNLRRFGWHPIHFWDDEVRDDEAGCVDRIRQAVSGYKIDT